jgi:hypothetical protein
MASGQSRITCPRIVDEVGGDWEIEHGLAERCNARGIDRLVFSVPLSRPGVWACTVDRSRRCLLVIWSSDERLSWDESPARGWQALLWEPRLPLEVWYLVARFVVRSSF